MNILIYIIVDLCLVFVIYEASIYILMRYADISASSAKQKIHQRLRLLCDDVQKVSSKIHKWFQPDPPPLNVYLDQGQIDELGKRLEKFFHAIQFRDFKDLPDKSIYGIRYDISGIRNVCNDRAIIIKSIRMEITKYYMETFGIKAFCLIFLSDEVLSFYVATSEKGFSILKEKEAVMIQARKSKIAPKMGHQIIEVDPHNFDITLGYLLNDYKQHNHIFPVQVNMENSSHMLITGQSGMGKSSLLELILRQLLIKEHLVVWFCDFKASNQFASYNESVPHFSSGDDDVLNMIYEFYDQYTKARNKEIVLENSQALILDEYPGFLSLLALKDKKEAEKVKGIIAELLMLGRSIGDISFKVILTAQRPDASLFPSGSRDQLHTWVALGNLSSEGKHMFTDDVSKFDNTSFSCGEGMVKNSYWGIQSIIVPETATTVAAPQSPAS